MLRISFKNLPTQELRSFANCVARLSSSLSKRALKAGYKESSRQLIKRYGLPTSGASKKSKPSVTQSLRLKRESLEAQDEPISLLRFVMGPKKMKLKNVRVIKRKGLKISLFPGASWRTKKAFSGMAKGNMHLFIKRKFDGKYKVQRQSVPSAYNVLTHDAPMKCIKRKLVKSMEKNMVKIIHGGT
jgi:hypothetical protein